jgi:hypothetical protein
VAFPVTVRGQLGKNSFGDLQLTKLQRVVMKSFELLIRPLSWSTGRECTSSPRIEEVLVDLLTLM